MASGDAAFVICQIGNPGSQTRARTDELCDFVLKPPLEERGLRLARADEDPTPGTVSVQIIQAIVDAKVVVADLTGRNANVYYELGVAHSFAKPLLILVDSTDSLAFDLQGERAIVIGDDGAEIGARKAAAAADEVRRQLDVVLAPGYVPQSLVRGAGVTSSLERFATDDPVKDQLVRISEQLDELRRGSPATNVWRQQVPTWSEPTAVDVVLRFRDKISRPMDLLSASSILQQLSPLELQALVRTWGLDARNPMTTTEIASDLGISEFDARQLVVMAFAKVQDGIEDRLGKGRHAAGDEGQSPQDPSSG